MIPPISSYDLHTCLFCSKTLLYHPLFQIKVMTYVLHKFKLYIYMYILHDLICPVRLLVIWSSLVRKIHPISVRFSARLDLSIHSFEYLSSWLLQYRKNKLNKMLNCFIAIYAYSCIHSYASSFTMLSV